MPLVVPTSLHDLRAGRPFRQDGLSGSLRLSEAQTRAIIGAMRKPDVQVSSHPAAGNAPSTRLCDCPGCLAVGDYPAPKARDRLRDYFWFCLGHVREYNRAWDFYAGMSPAEIEVELRSDTTWQRPTWPLGAWRLYEQRMRSRARGEDEAPFGRGDSGRDEDASTGDGEGRRRRPPSSPEDAARRVLNLEPTASFTEIKTRYRELVKKHHPDANGGDKHAEERLKQINQAYTTLKTHNGLQSGR
jgi:DnaJ-domain-containing protein 1